MPTPIQSPQPPPIDALLPMLLNEIALLSQPVILVLDDYHLIGARPVDDATFRRLPSAIAIARAGMALARGDVPAIEL